MMKVAILVALAGSCSANLKHDMQDALNDVMQAKSSATDNIKEYIKSLSSASVGFGDPLCTSYNCCNISASSECPLSTMAKDETTLVLPGGSTRCIYSYSTPYAFQVIPGASDKLLFYFQGGGACWDLVSSKAGFCTSDSSPQSPIGVFSRTDDRNKFKDFTIVHVLYCSGDVWGGNVTQPFDDDAGVPVQQQGLANAQAALDWAKQQQVAGRLSSSLSELVVMGCSAGSVGAQLWANQVLGALAFKTAAVIPDSYAGVFPPGSEGPLIFNYGFCSSGFLSEALLAKCLAQQLSLQDIMLEMMPAFPSIPFAFIQSKTDIVQQSFYIAIGVTTQASSKLIDPSLFYKDVNDIFGAYNALPNFVTYLVDGYQHCFTPLNVYFTADAQGKSDNGENSKHKLMHEWAGGMPLGVDGSADSVATVCDGKVQAKESAPVGVMAKINNFLSRNDYCESDIVPKTFSATVV